MPAPKPLIKAPRFPPYPFSLTQENALEFLPLSTSELQKPDLNHRRFRPQSTRERQDPVKQQKASKVSEVTIFQIFWSPFHRVIEDTWILQLGCLSSPCLILDCCNSANLFHLTSAAKCWFSPSPGHSCFDSVSSNLWRLPICSFW